MEYREIDEIVQKRDLQKANRLVEAFTPLILSSIRKYYNKEYLMDELVAEGKLIILESLLEYDPMAQVPFNHYLKVRLRYHYLKKNRERENISLQQMTADGLTVEDWIAADIDLEKDYVEKEERKALRNALGKLTKKQRKVLIEYYFQRKKAEEIARDAHVSKWTFYSTKRQALEQLKKFLED